MGPTSSVNAAVHFDALHGAFELPTSVPKGKRHEFAAFYARVLVLASTPRNQTGCFIDISPECTVRKVEKANRERCTPPLESSEVRHICNEVMDQAPIRYLDHWTKPTSKE